ncbi:hypothetical protein [Dongia sp.]|uniref:hypothetical protein n=1 Tax=Dongia sp. TaxID=1977262 RepID=UPI0035B3573E
MPFATWRPALLSLPLAAALAIAAVPGVGRAQSDEKVVSSATINAVSYEPIPPGAVLETQPETQSQMDDDAWRRADSDLSGRGYTIGSEGNLVLTVATQLTSRLSADQSVGEVNAKKTDPKNAALFSTEGNTLLNPRDPVNTTDRAFRINITVYDRSTGHYIWRGSAERADASIDPATAMREMLPALLDRLGETAKDVTVPLEQ